MPGVSTASAEVVREWLKAQVAAASPLSQDGTGFRHSGGEEPPEPLERMPKDDSFHRSFRVLYRRDGQPMGQWPTSTWMLEGNFLLRVGYLWGHHEELERMVNEDDEVLMVALCSQAAVLPSIVTRVRRTGTTFTDLEPAEGGLNATVLELVLEVVYDVNTP